ncbi:hypothetical protein UB34_21375, partial [Photobacterium leiognathi]|uniref:hypothetical protein n=1 Tax=Photobacterium leiognathi TaxID=553611 RepID=UPI0005D3DA76
FEKQQQIAVTMDYVVRMMHNMYYTLLILPLNLLPFKIYVITNHERYKKNLQSMFFIFEKQQQIAVTMDYVVRM